MLRRDNYFVFIVTRDNVTTGYRVGDIGTGKTDTCVGISDAAYGVFMTAPKHHIELCAARDRKSPIALSPEQIRDYVFDFWAPKEPRKSETQEEKEVVWLPHTW
jgi:hypothetical protein|tara:strand:- start:130 stop:441 length:312 start_codon:yes stop_codon:yes gene_type:complete